MMMQKNNVIKKLMAICSLFIICITSQTVTVSANETPAPQNQAELEKFIADYLLNNPDVLVKALDNAQEYMTEQSKRLQAEKLKSLADELTNDNRDFSIGPANAKVTIVEFFDYNCGYCKKALGDVMQLLEKNDDVRVVFKELPILGPTSRTAAEMALTAKSNEDYMAIHTELLSQKGGLSPARIDAIAQRFGINTATDRAKRTSKAMKTHLDDTRRLALELGINGTPGFVIGDQIIPGAVPYAQLQAAVDALK